MIKRDYGLVEQLLSDAAIKTARSKYSFDFTVDGVASRTWYDPKTGNTCFYCSKTAGDALSQLAMKIEDAILETQLKSHVNQPEIRNYLCKHLQAMNEVYLAMADMVKAKMNEKLQ